MRKDFLAKIVGGSSHFCVKCGSKIDRGIVCRDCFSERRPGFNIDLKSPTPWMGSIDLDSGPSGLRSYWKGYLDEWKGVFDEFIEKVENLEPGETVSYHEEVNVPGGSGYYLSITREDDRHYLIEPLLIRQMFGVPSRTVDTVGLRGFLERAKDLVYRAISEYGNTLLDLVREKGQSLRDMVRFWIE